LRAVAIPPKETGGDTEFADSRTAFDSLPEQLKQELVDKQYVGAHSMAHSRRLGSPEYFKDLDALATPMSRHYILQKHEPSGRLNLYVGAHLHHLEGVPDAESAALIETLNKHVSRPENVFRVSWEDPGDMVMWDNRCVQHRAAGGTFEGKYKRDLRRTTVHDDSPTAWGLNREGQAMPGFNYNDFPRNKPQVPVKPEPVPVGLV
jgi:alpha-ketoglutarate-dependent 2,4-dichlorophenoxyacetate dioxygenase